MTTTSIQPDTAAAGSALTANAGSAVSFNQATATGTGPLKYAWSFGDGTTATGTLNATHTYATAGTYSAQLTVTDALGIPITSTVSVAVNGTGTSAPIVSAGSPITDNADTSVTFSQATETGGTAPFAYSWNFGDGTTATGSLNPSHTYMNPGSYTATVTVTDANKLTSSSSLAVTVKDVVPSVTIADPTGTVGTPVSFSATATSLSPAVETAGFTYAWTFGDGGTSTGATPTHTYTTAGTYTATVTAKDEYGMTGTASETITIVSAGCRRWAESPASGATNVAVSSSVTADFTQAMQASTISFTLKTSSGTGVAATVAYNSSTDIATLTPTAALAYGTTYVATVSGAEDTAGVAMPAVVSWSFTTAPKGTVPTVIGVSPASGASGVAVPSAILAFLSLRRSASRCSPARLP